MTPDQLTDDQKKLIQAMNLGGETRLHGLYRTRNIAALHFDGQVLIDLLTARRELENRERRA